MTEMPCPGQSKRARRRCPPPCRIAALAMLVAAAVAAYLVVAGGGLDSSSSSPGRGGPARDQAVLQGPGSAASQVPTAPGSPPAPPGASDRHATAHNDQELEKLAVGTWEDHYQGKRTMTLRPDGTGTMLVELSGIKASLFADRLRFEMEWSVENGHLKKRTVRGEPAGQVNLILTWMGDRVSEKILELSDQRLLLLDEDGQTQYDWKRVRRPRAASRP